LLVTGNEVWRGTFENGLDVLNIITGKVERHYASGAGERSLKSSFIYCIAQMSTCEIMLGTTTGAYEFNRAGDDFSLLPGMPPNNWNTGIFKDKNDVIGASTYGNGINFYNTKTKTAGNFRYEAGNRNSLCNDRVNSIFEDSKNNLCFATEGGLCMLNKTTNDFKRYTSENGLPSNLILCILDAERNNL